MGDLAALYPTPAYRNEPSAKRSYDPEWGCMISYYGEDAAGLRLGDEFHVNRQQLVSARVESLPLRPRMDAGAAGRGGSRLADFGPSAYRRYRNAGGTFRGERRGIP
jgi:hypothetical protein